jgi:hypothetical protein
MRTTITLRLSPELERALEEAVARTGESAEQLAQEALREYLERVARPLPRSVGIVNVKTGPRDDVSPNQAQDADADGQSNQELLEQFIGMAEWMPADGRNVDEWLEANWRPRG